MPELAEAPRSRPAVAGDRAALRAFRCSLGTWYEDEVEEHIQHEALDYAAWRAWHTGYRLMTFETREGIVAVGAHEIGDLTSHGSLVPNTYINLIAVRLDYRRRRVSEVDEPRVGEYVLDALIADAKLQRPHDRLIYASIARENKASLRLFRGRGFAQERLHPDERFLRLLGTLPPAP